MIALKLNILQKKFKKSLERKILSQIFIEYKHTILQCMDTFGFMLKNKTLLDYRNLFSPSKYERNDKIILNVFNN